MKRLPELTNEMVCILKNMETMTITYKLSVTNLEFTLGLTENKDNTGNKINDLFLPMSLRVKDSSVEKSGDGEIVDFIFSKDARACLKNHSCNLRAPLCGIFYLHSVDVARYAALI